MTPATAPSTPLLAMLPNPPAAPCDPMEKPAAEHAPRAADQQQVRDGEDDPEEPGDAVASGHLRLDLVVDGVDAGLA